MRSANISSDAIRTVGLRRRPTTKDGHNISVCLRQQGCLTINEARMPCNDFSLNDTTKTIETKRLKINADYRIQNRSVLEDNLLLNYSVRVSYVFTVKERITLKENLQLALRYHITDWRDFH